MLLGACVPAFSDGKSDTALLKSDAKVLKNMSPSLMQSIRNTRPGTALRNDPFFILGHRFFTAAAFLRVSPVRRE